MFKKLRALTFLTILSVGSLSFASATRTIDADALISADHSKLYSLPAATDTLVGRSSTDVLTNKFLNILRSQDVTSGTSEAVTVTSGNGTSTGAAGDVTVKTGASDQGSGSLLIFTANPTAADVGGGSVDIRSGTVTGTGASGAWSAASGNSDLANTGAVDIRSGTSTGGGSSGGMSLATGGASSTGTSGALAISTGDTIDGASGLLSFISGTASGSGASGNSTIATGVATGGTSGNIILTTGVGLNTGTVNISTSAPSAIGDSGGINISSGATTDGSPGQISISVGKPTGTGTWSNILLSARYISLQDNNGASVIPLRMYDTDGSAYVSLEAPSAVTADYAIKLPVAQGAADTAMVNDGSGNLSFTGTSVWKKFTVTFSQFTDAADNQTITLFSLPNGYIVEKIILHVTTGFQAPAATSYTLEIGDAENPQKMMYPYQSLNADSSASGKISASGWFEDFDVPNDITITARIVDDTLDQATQGSATVWVQVSRFDVP